MRTWINLYMKMMMSTAVPYTGNADIDFRTKMIRHHQGAIDMANPRLVQSVTSHGRDQMIGGWRVVEADR